MKCRRVRQLLFDFVDGLGNEALHVEVDRHLAECVDCEKFAAESKRSLALLRRAPVEPLDENFNWKVRLAIHREQRATAKRASSAGAWVRAWNFRYVASTGIAFAFVLGAGIVVVNNVVPSGPSLPSIGHQSTPSRSDVAQSHRGSLDIVVALCGFPGSAGKHFGEQHRLAGLADVRSPRRGAQSTATPRRMRSIR